MLKKLIISGFRPFFEDATLNIEPDVTVLTGANDSGKSAILDIVRRLSTGAEGSEDDINIDRDSQASKPWNENTDIRAIASYTQPSLANYMRQSVEQHCEVDLLYLPTMNSLQVSAIRNDKGKSIAVRKVTLSGRPRVLDLTQQHNIRTSISSENLNTSENILLELAFRENYWDRLSSLSPRNQNTQRDIANKILNSRLAETKPESLHVEFSLDFESHEPLVISVGLQDSFGGRAWPHLRGAGYQKLIKLMLVMLTIDIRTEPVILLYDEPENSLHADAQHSLRRVLESYAQHPNIQIIYATHSPSMINPSRPKNLRLLTRVQTTEGVATTRISNKPYTDNNFQMIRASLGMSPADSLLYAPISVIVEGATETLGLNRLFRSLMKDAKNDLHRELHRLIGHIHFCWCRRLKLCQMGENGRVSRINSDRVRRRRSDKQGEFIAERVSSYTDRPFRRGQGNRRCYSSRNIFSGTCGLCRI